MSILRQEAVKKLRELVLKGEPSKVLSSSKPTPFKLEQPRLVNGFSLGCDPEFLLLHKVVVRGETDAWGYSSGNRTIWNTVSARDCGLRVDEAFGCDGAGVPVELRAHPSRFAIEVVGSLLNTLRWMYLATDRARACSYWGAGSYINKVALGGHIHLGRKAGVREREIMALNRVCETLEREGFFQGSKDRREKTGYGRLGDYRKQAWGYEYRSFGCFLYSPAIAHLLLTLSKLAVLDPEVGEEIRSLSSISNILAFYRFLDDDASIAYRGLQRTFKTRPVEGNILKTWGLEGWPVAGSGYKYLLADKMPSTIPADEISLREVTDSIINGAKPPQRVPEASWKIKHQAPASSLPVHLLAPDATNEGGPYLGERELVCGLYAINESKIRIYPARHPYEERGLEISFDFYRLLNSKELERLEELAVSIGASILKVAPKKSRLEVGLNRRLRQNVPLRVLKKLFESGTLPVASSSNVSANWCEMWQKRLKRAGLYQE